MERSTKSERLICAILKEFDYSVYETGKYKKHLLRYARKILKALGGVGCKIIRYNWEVV